MEDLLQAIEAVQKAVSALLAESGALADMGEPPDHRDLVWAFVALDDALGGLREAKNDVGEAAHHAMPSRQDVVGGLGEVNREWPKNRKEWRHDDLLDLIVARSRDERRVTDPATGEYESELVAFLRALRECAGFSYWKANKVKNTGLASRGIDPEDYCRVEKGRPTISVPSAAKRAAAAAERALRAPESAASAEQVSE